MSILSEKRVRRFFILKIDLPALIAFGLFAGLIFFYLIPGFEKVMMDRKRTMIREMTSTAYSLLEYYHSLEEKGEIEGNEAREQASAAISELRYGDQLKDYFWITDMYPRMIVHPYRSDLNGKDLTDFRDSKGKTVFTEFVRAVSPTGESFVDYMWQWNDDSTRIVPKLSYVRLFGPWDWIIGTGIYIEDVRQEIKKIETLALIVSGIIALVIIVLLTLMSRQSHKIEQERSRAEDELRKSRELYRTLAEAASEAVLIWSEQGLQANKTMLSWLGYTDEELRFTAIHDIINAHELFGDRNYDSLYEELSARLSADCQFKMKDGSVVKSRADLSGIRIGRSKAVLVVARPAKPDTPVQEFSMMPELLNNISPGFFRITYGRKNLFLSATEPTLRMLGFTSLKELHAQPIESFFVNPLEFKNIRSVLAARKNIPGKVVLLKRKDGYMFRAFISVMVVEKLSQDIWCEGTIEFIAGHLSPDNAPITDLLEFGASYFSDIRISELMRAPVECPETATFETAISLLKENKARILVAVNRGGEPTGTIDTDTIIMHLAGGGSTSAVITGLMNPLPQIMNGDTTVSMAFGLLNTRQQGCLLVLSADGKASGVVTPYELSGAFISSPGLLLLEINGAGDAASLESVYLKSRKLAITMLIGKADPHAVSLFLSEIADSICRRSVDICLEKLGEPPCRFAFIQSGSAGRMEQSLLTDQDNGIIFEDTDTTKLKDISDYFLALGRMVNDTMMSAGYRLCKGGNMAGNDQWCQPLRTWKKYFSDWIRMPGPEELLEVSIFFDFRFCYGDKELSDSLREYITVDLRTTDIFFHHMTAGWKRFNPSVKDIDKKKTDIKKILMPLTGIARLYALREGIGSFSTIDRLLALYEAERIDARLLHDAIRAWKDLTSLRLTHQASLISRGKDPDNILDFRAESAELAFLAKQAVLTINDLLLKAGSDFYTDTI